MALGDKVSTGQENQGRSGVDGGWLTLKLYCLSNSRHGLAPKSLAMRKCWDISGGLKCLSAGLGQCLQ